MTELLGYDRIEAALDELLALLEEKGPPGSVSPVEQWFVEQGIDPDAVREATAYAVQSTHPIHRGEAAVAWTEGFTIGWMLARRERGDRL